MVNTHEIELDTAEFEDLRDSGYIILKLNDIEVNDYILFKQVDSGLFQMTQVSTIIKNDGLKEGFGLLMVNKL